MPHLQKSMSIVIRKIYRLNKSVVCFQVYYNIKRIGLHFFSNPDHATSPKSIEILTNYKNAMREKKVTTADAECQTMDCENLHKADDSKESKKHHKSPNVKIDREDRSLFKFFIRLLQKTAPEHRANIFIRQLAILTAKLRKLLPCLLQKSENNSLCSINDPVAKYVSFFTFFLFCIHLHTLYYIIGSSI